jgi:hypothetical protein
MTIVLLVVGVVMIMTMMMIFRSYWCVGDDGDPSDGCDSNDNDPSSGCVGGDEEKKMMMMVVMILEQQLVEVVCW